MHSRDLFVRARRRDHLGAERLGELDRRRADPRRPAVNEQGLAGLERAAVEDIRPDGKVGFGDRGRLDRRQPERPRQGVRFVRDAVVGVAAAGNERRHPRAFGISGGAGAARHDRAGDLEAEDVARARRRRVEPHALEDVRPIDAGRLDLDQDFAGPGEGPRTRLDHKNLRPPGAGRRDRAHRLLPVRHRADLPE